MNILFVFATIFMPLEKITISDGSIRVEVVSDDPTWSRYSHNVREVQVVRETMVFVSCVDPPFDPVKKLVRDFVRCMGGPPYICGPIGDRPNSQFWWRNLPPSERPYVCVRDLASCVSFDLDCDGDVDIKDWARRMVLFSEPQFEFGEGSCGGPCRTRICSPDEDGRPMKPSSCEAASWTCVPK